MTAAHHVIDPAAWIAQPWRNGAGTTHELVRWPAAAERFAVRVSVADLTAPAPFSAFAGYQRWLFLLDGGPVTLAVDGESTTLARAGDHVRFAGEAAVAAGAVASPSRDLNFMVAVDHPGRVQLERGGAHVLDGRFAAVFALAGPVTVDGAPLGRHGCAWIEGGPLAIEVGEGGLAATLVVLR